MFHAFNYLIELVDSTLFERLIRPADKRSTLQRQWIRNVSHTLKSDPLYILLPVIAAFPQRLRSTRLTSAPELQMEQNMCTKLTSKYLRLLRLTSWGVPCCFFFVSGPAAKRRLIRETITGSVQDLWCSSCECTRYANQCRYRADLERDTNASGVYVSLQ